MDKKMHNPLVSVIVPIYGIEAYLKPCLDSLVRQTYENLEIILVDDGSNDGCPQICDEYQKKYPRRDIIVLHKQNGGLVSARQEGLKIARGDLIGYVDGDDWVEPDFYEEMVKAQQDEDSDVVAAGFSRDILEKTEKLTNNIGTGFYTGKKMVSEIFTKMLCAGNYFYFGIYSYVWNKLFKKNVLWQAQMDVDRSITVGEDVACTFPALLEADSIRIIDNTAYHYVQRNGSMLKTVDRYDIEEQRLNVLEAFLTRRFMKSRYSLILMPQLTRYMMGIRMIRGDSYCRNGSGCCVPFGLIDQNKRIAIYNAGTFGQNLYARFQLKKCQNVVGWFDPDYEQYQEQGLPVQSPEVLDQNCFDKIFIAALDERYIEKVRIELAEKVVPSFKILTVYTGLPASP